MTDQTPIAATIRHDGWTPERRTQFLDHLANHGSGRAACGRAGMSREAAYRLRRRDGLFARAWDAALVLARAACAEVLASRAIDGVEEEIWYRGELIGTRRKYDSRLLLAHIARLDCIAEDCRANDDAARFDELLALNAGEEAPEALKIDGDPLPMARAEAVSIAIETAGDEWDQDPEARVEEDCCSACINAAAEAVANSEAWLAQAFAKVDGLLEEPAAAALLAEPGTLSELSTSPVAAPGQGAPHRVLNWPYRSEG